MNLPEEQLEKILRQAPRPRPTPGLRQRLVDGIDLPAGRREFDAASAPPDQAGSWLQRWRVALAVGSFAVVSLVVLAQQQARISQLQDAIRELRQSLEAAQPVPVTEAPTHVPAEASITDGQAEIERLRATLAGLNTDVAALEAMRQENNRLRAEGSSLSAEETAALDAAKERAQRIACVNNLKQLGLAARIWATDNGDVLPPDLLSMSNEIIAPKILVCPADTARKPAASWAEFSLANVSYEFLGPSASETEPQRVVFRCPIHRNVCLADGSVQQLSPESAAQVVSRNGALYVEAPMARPPANPNPAGQPRMDRRMMERYGLLPAPTPAPEPEPTDPNP